jgi:hypothetical protein
MSRSCAAGRAREPADDTERRVVELGNAERARTAAKAAEKAAADR